MLYPPYPRSPLTTIEGDAGPFTSWQLGQTGAGRFHRYPGHMEPPSDYAKFIKKVLRETPSLHPWTRQMLHAGHPEQVYFSIQPDGHALVLNYNEEPARIVLDENTIVNVEPFGIARLKLKDLP